MVTKKCQVVLAIVMLLSIMLVACAPGATPTPASKAAATPAARSAGPSPTAKPAGETPKYGGIFSSMVSDNPPSLDPQQDPTINTQQIVAPIYTRLVEVDPLTVDKLVPGLAEKWTMSQDGLTWTFDIRQGVKFHDGTPLTVDDAVFSVKRLAGPPKGVLSAMEWLLKPQIKSVEKDGTKLRINLTEPFAMMLDSLAINFSAIYSEKHVEKYGDMKTTAMGTGPFKLKSHTAGVGLEAVKNPDFWLKGRPYLDGYRFAFIKDAATRLSAFRTGKVQMTGKVFGTLLPSEMETLKKEDPKLSFYPSATLIGGWFFMNVRKPPFKEQRVRKAISLALNRQAALKVLGQGYGVLGKFFPAEPWGIPNDELVKMPGFRESKDADLAEAKKLMQEAGYSDGFDVTVLSRQNWQTKDPAVLMTNQLGQLGIRAKLNVLEDSIFWDSGRKAVHQAMVYTPTVNVADPQWMGRYFIAGGGLNFAGNDDDKELTKMWVEQGKTVDPEKRKVLIRKVEEYLFDALPGIPVAWPYFYIGVRPEVRNFTPGISDYLGNTLEEIWLSK